MMIDPSINDVHVSQTGTNTISVIDTDGLLVGVMFNVDPSSSDHIYCDKSGIGYVDNYKRFPYDGVINCEAKTSNGLT